jgi:cytochrome c oxidase assembly factor CtaG
LLHPWQFVFDPEWAVAIVIVAVDYGVVVWVARRTGRVVPLWRQAAFTAGLAAIAIGLLSPIEHLALTSMLTFHLLQNVIIGDWAPPLLLLGLTPWMISSLAKVEWLRTFMRPKVALGLWLGVWYVIHIPALYDYALTNRGVLGVEHLALIFAGLAFWWPEIVPGQLSADHKVWYLVIAFIAIAPLDTVIWFANHPLYGFYEHTPKLGDISALADQQIGGVTMALESDFVLLLAAAIAAVKLVGAEPPAQVSPGPR